MKILFVAFVSGLAGYLSWFMTEGLPEFARIGVACLAGLAVSGVAAGVYDRNTRTQP